MDKIKSIRGMHDIYDLEFRIQKTIINNFQLIADSFNFKPIETPIMEFSEIFNRTLGNSSDVVMKEMYTFLDRSNEQITLRPEGTAGVARAIISNGLTQDLPLKFYYYGPMFRYERPQKGRLRQFGQVGVEVYSNSNIEKEFEVISLANAFLGKLNIKDNLILQINNLGNLEDRNIYIKKLKSYYFQYKSKLSKDSILRLQKNPLRILDSKDPQDIELNENAPRISDYLSLESKNDHLKLLELLKEFNITFEENPFLVRGLDYYNNTIFEFTLKKDRKFAVLAGGTYDSLVSDLGGPKISGIGWAAGIERLSSMLDWKIKEQKKILIISMNSIFLNEAFKVRQSFLNSGFVSEVFNSKNLKKSLKYANKIKADFAIIVGEDEIKNSLFSVKDLKTGLQKKIKDSSLVEHLKNA
jgi:histidyl-tRNA synthetase